MSCVSAHFFLRLFDLLLGIHLVGVPASRKLDLFGALDLARWSSVDRDT
jgi:hypothetical protein